MMLTFFSSSLPSLWENMEVCIMSFSDSSHIFFYRGLKFCLNYRFLNYKQFLDHFSCDQPRFRGGTLSMTAQQFLPKAKAEIWTQVLCAFIMSYCLWANHCSCKYSISQSISGEKTE